MPRASTVKTEEVETASKKRAPRKRVVHVGGAEENTPTNRTRARKTTPKDSSVNVMADSDSRLKESQTRRAPTALQEQKTVSRRFSRTLMIAATIFVLLSGVGVAIGLSDQGEIDVVAVVNERNERVLRGEVREGESTFSVPVQNTDVRPNGGLVPADPSVSTEPNPEVATSTENGTGTTSSLEIDDSATSTDDEIIADVDVSGGGEVSEVEVVDGQ